MRKIPLVPSACDLRLSISWLTTSSNHMNNSHIATDKFYHNLTKCVLVKSNKIKRTVDFTEPVMFSFNFRKPTKDNKKMNLKDTKKNSPSKQVNKKKTEKIQENANKTRPTR